METYLKALICYVQKITKEDFLTYVLAYQYWKGS